MHGELEDFTSRAENGRYPRLDTTKHDAAWCSQFAAEHISQRQRSLVGCCLSRLAR